MNLRAASFVLLLACLVSSCGKLNTLNSVSSDASLVSGSEKFKAFKTFFASKCNECHESWSSFTEEEWVSQGYVVAGSSSSSTLFLRLKNNGIAGSAQDMPDSSETNSDSEVAVVRDWIDSLSL
ncbi:hypothetical protein EBZ37_05710 [bacterium]|nr:hypothetical protein [bacterium]